MPELPEVETIARDLRGLVTGARITGASGDWPKTIRSHEPAAFAEAVTGRPIEGVGRRGKQLLLWLGPSPAEEGPAANPAVLTWHLKMTGQLFVVDPVTPRDRHVHLVLAFEDGRELRFRDIRKFGRVGLYRRDPATGLPVEGEADGVLAEGDEPLGEDFTSARFAANLATRRGRLKSLLLNQDFIAGVGNIYADEALWRARLHPLRDARSVRPADARRLYEALRAVLIEAVARRGSSVDDYTAPEGDGSMQEHLQVYQRAGEPCDRCGRKIARIVVGGRATHFCPNCQRLPKGHPAERVAARAEEKTTGRAVERTPGRRGPRWTELSGEGALGRTAAEEARARRTEANSQGRRGSTGGGPGGSGRRHGARFGEGRFHGRPGGRPGARLMSLVRLDGVTREVGDFVILDRVSAAIAAGDRIGLVGPNGAGKTTLLRMVAGLDEPDRGDVLAKKSLTLALLPQEAHVDSTFTEAPSLRQAVRAGAVRVIELERILRQMEVDGRVTEPEYEQLQHEFAHREGYGLDQRVEAALSGLGFSREEWERQPTNLSGGEQTRGALARLLMSDPEMLLLDEPTNHLDLAALEWLEDHLGRRNGALLVASHDRAFLDATVNRVWELRDRRLTQFRGNYSAYARQREERDLRAAEDAEDREGQIQRERELVQLYRHQRKFSKMHEHEARLEALEPMERRREDAKLRLPTEALAGGAPARSYDMVVRAEGLVVGYRVVAGGNGADGAVVGGSRADGAVVGGNGADGNGARLAKPVEVPVARASWLELHRGDRVGIVGPNGAGKTTLLRTVAGELAPIDGALDIGRNVQLSYLAQLRDAAIPGTTVLDAVLDALPLSQGQARSHLARFLFRGDEVQKELRALSGGERSRLELALLFLLPANLLLLDEPTNHLDIAAREALEAFLASTDATILVVSHDRRLLEKVCDTLWVVDDGLAVTFDGGYRAWRQAVADGWTTKAAVESEARRLHGGRTAPAGRRTGDASAGPTQQSESRKAGGGVPSIAASTSPNGPAPAAPQESGRPAPPSTPPAGPRPKLSKDAYRRRKAQIDEELVALAARKRTLESALADPSVHGNFVELRRVSGELATVNEALAAAEEAWLELEEAAP